MKIIQNLIVQTTILCVLLLSTGCAPVNPIPFQDYDLSTRRLQEGMEVVFLIDRQMTTEGFVTKLVEDNGKDITNLSIRFPTDPDSFDLDYGGSQQPLFIKIAEMGRQMERLNNAFSDYATLLVMLAGSEIVDQEIFDNLAKDLNGNIHDTANQLEKLDVTLPDNFNKGVGIFSTAAVEGFRAYIENKRRDTLKSAVEINQDLIDQWSEVARNALKNIRDDLQHEYQRSRKVFSKTLITNTDPDTKRQAAQNLIQLNASIFGIMGVLQGLNLAYSKMPEAHKNLSESLSEDAFSLPALKSYYEQARRIQSLYKSISQQPSS